MSLLLSHCRCRISIDDSVLSNELILSIYQYQSGEAIDHVNMLSFNQVMGPNGQSTTRVVHSLDLMIIYPSYSVRTDSTSTESRSPRHILCRVFNFPEIS